MCIKEKSRLRFKVKSCHDAEISLMTNDKLSDTYLTIAFGNQNNTLTYIYKPDHGGETMVSTSINQKLLNCNNFKDFWIEWDNQRLTFGENSSELLKTITGAISVQFRYLTVATSKNATGNWVIQLDDQPSGTAKLH